MRIGIDLDDTICSTSDIVHEMLDDYAKEMNLDPVHIMNDESLRFEFFNKNLINIYTNVEIKSGAKDIINKMHSKDNEIYLITARTNGIYNVEEITKKWLDSNGVLYDELIMSSYGDGKAKVCKQNKIDLMIDDDPYNYKMISLEGINCLLFDDRAKYELKENYVTSWYQIEKYFEGE